MNILIVKLSALGDVTHTLPALCALRRAHPEARIDWVVEETAAPIVTEHTALSHALVWSRRTFTGALRSGHWLRAFRLLHGFIRQLRATRYDLILDFQGLLKSGIWVFLARGRRKAGFGPGLDHSEGSYLFLNERVPAVSMDLHALDRGLHLLEAVGIPRGPVEYCFPVTPADTKRVDRLLEEHRVSARESLVVLHPMTRWPTKLWFPARFAEVADALTRQGCRVAFTGAAQDRAALDEICVHLKHPALRFEGQLNLKELAALFQRSRLVVATDTGPMHIAVAVGTPVVALFGPTAPHRTGPHGPHHLVLQANVACRPCFSRTCRTPVAETLACMHRIEVDAVLRATRQILDAPPPEGPPPSTHSPA